MEKEQNFAKALIQLRKSKDITLEQISDFCKIKKNYLEKIESGNFFFKSEVYIKLFIKEYIKYIDQEKVDSVMQEFNSILNKTNTVSNLTFMPLSSDVHDQNDSEPLFDSHNYNPKKIATIIFVIIVIIFTYQIVVSYFLS